MLNNTDLSLMVRIRAALASSNDAALVVLGTELDAVLVHHTAHAASVADAAKRRVPKSKPGRTGLFYIVELEPGWRMATIGAEAAQRAVADALKELGSKRSLPKPTSFAAMMATNGAWTALVETDNGTVSITARKATPAEAERYQRELDQEQESGTDLAQSKTHAKKTKTT